MSSKLLSQIKAGDRVCCTASAYDLDETGLHGLHLGAGLGTIACLETEDWASVLFDTIPQVPFSVRVEHLKIVNRADSEEIEEAVINQIRSRRDAGRSKYGTTMERTDLSILQWVQHAQEEAMDFSIYLEKLKRVLKKKGIE